MERASNSKRIMEVESELRSRMAIKGQNKFAREAGWAESKVSRLNVHDMAVTFVLLEKIWETSVIREIARQAVIAVTGKQKAPAVTEASEQQITMSF
ncbi:CII family transcriptional regulator [Yersinia enterocolitica]|uniref:CII family transcriptional regulator n=1 Tax=Yersinia enterocolitica TaxID=630 RepID=UPI003F453F3E